MSEIIEQAIHALHAYTPFLPAVKTGQPRRYVYRKILLIFTDYKDILFDNSSEQSFNF